MMSKNSLARHAGGTQFKGTKKLLQIGEVYNSRRTQSLTKLAGSGFRSQPETAFFCFHLWMQASLPLRHPCPMPAQNSFF